MLLKKEAIAYTYAILTKSYVIMKNHIKKRRRIMKKVTLKVLKPFLYLMTNAAFLLIVTNVNATCCGPGYQPEFPEGINELKRLKEDE